MAAVMVALLGKPVRRSMGPITGNTDLAANTPCVPYSISAVSGATGYTWTVPAGAIITSGQGTTGIIVDFGTTGGNVSVRSENSCGNSIYTDLSITIDCNLQLRNRYG